MIIGEKYRLIKELGAGGMGEVMLCDDLSHTPSQRSVVLKRVLKSQAEDKQSLAKFADEVRLMTRLKHNNIVETIEFFEDESTLYLVLEYVEGETVSLLSRLANALDEDLPTPLILRIGIEAARACLLYTSPSPRD